MAHALVALGANLGDRARQLGGALDEFARLPESQLIRRSGWFETPPIGGPTGQGAFLNGAALLETSLAPTALLAALQRIEDALGRVRTERWGARVIDLDLLLYDQFVSSQQHSLLSGSLPLEGRVGEGVERWYPLQSPLPSPPPQGEGTSESLVARSLDGSQVSEIRRPPCHADNLIVPHPRMAFRRFVLEPAAAVAPGMIHPPSGWTVAALLRQLQHGTDVAAVIADSEQQAEAWAERLRAHFRNAFAASPGALALPQIVTWAAYRAGADESRRRRPKLILNFSSASTAAGESPTQPARPAFHAGAGSRRMPNLPTGGPVAWISQLGAADPMTEAAAAIQAVWPELAAVAPPSD
ncbi:2-amino-4-hydroxy-6-hydroxymethyldihydropteridine diphosphokinase [Lacipirellula parvula]|uniref:2-amino-4-hydroxy-6-hydroxymethyldihydropteridine pyrophosphokinase n=1 Tax=Lacipirellula parvula TaxID=2650471 RepID=A0A5K7XHG3_9BACT|nr:2-amino-4-hydroxy-6-hydroxymethyldihydropteridine diphosphokinase [Lacipirellula parvula]BBO36320.1 2-amino-4-hydroxy-6-hydroxymethyldihydropteridine pyrophosphokinase [Lacipirellula parvula]